MSYRDDFGDGDTMVGHLDLSMMGGFADHLAGPGVQFTDRDRSHVTQRDTQGTPCQRGRVEQCRLCVSIFAQLIERDARPEPIL